MVSRASVRRGRLLARLLLILSRRALTLALNCGVNRELRVGEFVIFMVELSA